MFPNITVLTILGLQITVPVVSDMSSAGNSIDDCSSGSGGGSPDADATGSEEIGAHHTAPLHPLCNHSQPRQIYKSKPFVTHFCLKTIII